MSSPNKPAHLLIIRFSSFGDIVHAMGVPQAFLDHFNPLSEDTRVVNQVDWLVREDLASLLDSQPAISRILKFSRRDGVVGLVRLAWRLASAGYSHVYDAHNNVRSHLFCLVYFFAQTLRLGARRSLFARRPKNRIRRWLFFRWKLPVLPVPFRAARSFHEPLVKWGLKPEVPESAQYHPPPFLRRDVLDQVTRLPRPLIALVPSAAWEMKRWPLTHWETLVRLLPDCGFVFLGGPDDHFIEPLAQKFQDRSINLAGRLSLTESSSLLHECDLVISNDTGLLQVADQMARPTIALIGPTAFGYPSHATSEVAEINLWCKPCSKDGSGKCVNTLYQRCLVELAPEFVAQRVRARLKLATRAEANPR